jgi:hypothetical protein
LIEVGRYKTKVADPLKKERREELKYPFASRHCVVLRIIPFPFPKGDGDGDGEGDENGEGKRKKEGKGDCSIKMIITP